MLERLISDKHSNLLGQFLSYEENEVLWMRTQGPVPKHMTIVNDDSSVVSVQSFQLIDNARGIIYNRHMFIIQATGSFVDKDKISSLWQVWNRSWHE